MIQVKVNVIKRSRDPQVVSGSATVSGGKGKPVSFRFEQTRFQFRMKGGGKEHIGLNEGNVYCQAAAVGCQLYCSIHEATIIGAMNDCAETHEQVMEKALDTLSQYT